MRKRYRKPFLKTVIVRADFASPIESLQKALPPKVSRLLLKSFPISEPQRAIAREFMITPEETKEHKSEEMNWFYYGTNREKKACVSPRFFFVEHLEYGTFENLKNDFLPVIAELFTSVEDLQVKRFGLRYVDHIEISGGAMFDWKEYLDDSLLCCFSIPRVGKEIVRAFNTLALSDGQMILQFRYGMHNADFPAQIKTKLFILDFDAFTQGLLELDEIRMHIDSFHDSIDSLFEQVITDKLREAMGSINETE